MPKTAEKSVQSLCREAMQRLADRGQIFTEIDVINRVSQGQGWPSRYYREAADRAYIVLQMAYRQGYLVRFGPVVYNGHQDYARKATKIAYALRDGGPESWETPNGSFPRLLAEDDHMAAPGRKPKDLIDRDDAHPWSYQNGNGKVFEEDDELERRVEELEAQFERFRASMAAFTAA